LFLSFFVVLDAKRVRAISINSKTARKLSHPEPETATTENVTSTNGTAKRKPSLNQQ